jgi:hypothetical protein
MPPLSPQPPGFCRSWVISPRSESRIVALRNEKGNLLGFLCPYGRGYGCENFHSVVEDPLPRPIAAIFAPTPAVECRQRSLND